MMKTKSKSVDRPCKLIAMEVHYIIIVLTAVTHVTKVLHTCMSTLKQVAVIKLHCFQCIHC